MIIKNGGKLLKIDSFLEGGFYLKLRGLMFRSRKKAPIILFNIEKSDLHSFFVFFRFLVIWLNNGKVVVYEIVKPFSFSIKTEKKFDSILEVPISDDNRYIMDFIVGKRFKKN